MFHTTHLSHYKPSFKNLLFCGIIVLLFSCLGANAQRHVNTGLTYGGGSNGDSEWGITLTGGYDVPTGGLASTYKAAPTFAIGVIRNYGDFTFNATIGYVSYKAKVDTFYFDPADHTQGYVHYSNFSSIEFFTGAAYNIDVNDMARFYMGVDLGTYYTHFDEETSDGVVVSGSYFADYEEEYIAPKIGINFMMSDNLSLGVEAKYNFRLSSSSGSGDAYDYGYSTNVTKSYSGNLVLTYNF